MVNELNARVSWKNPSYWVAFISLVISFYVGKNIHPTWFIERVALDVQKDENGVSYFLYKDKKKYLNVLIEKENSILSSPEMQMDHAPDWRPLVEEEYVHEIGDEGAESFYWLKAKKHWRYWSLLPALVAIILCWLVKEPLFALISGIVSGALVLGRYDILEQVLVPQLMTKSAAGVLLLYLWLLGGLMGIWSKTGAAQAFAEYMTKKFVRGPRSAKFVAWCMGVMFFQGGTVSTVLVGTAVKPIADREKVSHEELSFVVDSTASPIASQLAFNAWPGYVQAFIFVAGVPWLKTESDRITFFFKSVPFCFYAIFAVLLTLLVSLEKMQFLWGKGLRNAMKRARETGELDAPTAHPLSAKALQISRVPKHYKAHVLEFFLPLCLLIVTAIGSFIIYGTPMVRWAFGVSLFSAFVMALWKGMALRDLMEGVADGLKGVVTGSVILLLAMTIGNVSKEVGGGVYLVELLGQGLPFWILPVILQLLTILIAFSTGTSWGTYAVAFPLAMPLAWSLAQHNGLSHPQLYMTICFAAVMDGSVYGDQCSPISDTTVLSSMCTGCDLMDHVKTQIPPASFAALVAGALWTACSFLTV